MIERIQNARELCASGKTNLRQSLVAILEAGLEASDPYENVKSLFRIERNRLLIGRGEFEPPGDPRTGAAEFDLGTIGRILVVGAAKGVQRAAKAVEDTLGDRLSGGHVIDKKGAPRILERIGVTMGSHPAPDADCETGSRRILETITGLTERDLVITLAGNGISSLLTLPLDGLSIEDVRETTRVMQIEKGVPTNDLNAIRNHIDQLKGGRISRLIHPAQMVHIVLYEPLPYQYLMYEDPWLHTLPDSTTFATAIDVVDRWDAWGAIPGPVRRVLEERDPANETVKAEEFGRMSFRIFEVMPQRGGIPFAALEKARSLGFSPVILAEKMMNVEASQAAIVIGTIALTVEKYGEPVKPPCALFSSGEMVVAVKDESGIGGRQQEFVLCAAKLIKGSDRIAIGSVDTDGTDGPGTQFASGEGLTDIPCLAGGVVDGTTVAEAERMNVPIDRELLRHNTTPVLLKLKSGVLATPNIRMDDLTVVLIDR